MIVDGAPVRLGGDLTATTVAARRWSRARLPLLVAALVLLTVAVAALVRPAGSTVPLSVDNAGADGTRALAEVLRDQGVAVTQVRTTAQAVARAGAGTTLAVVTSWLLTPDDVAELASTDADLVLLGVEAADLDELSGGTLQLVTGVTAEGVLTADCDAPAARAAQTVQPVPTGRAITASGPAAVCFPVPGGSGAGLFATATAQGRSVTALEDPFLLSNQQVATAGHAALGLTALGADDRLTWFLPSAELPTGSTGPGAGDLLPAWTGPAAALLAAVVAGAALWRGRALGPVVAEPLPVVVRSAETTRGRGRLYRRSRSRGHAAAALRAGTAHRCAQRIGLPRSAGAPAVIDALAAATRRRQDDVASLLYGPPPTDDAALLALARALDQLESEVHHT